LNSLSPPAQSIVSDDESESFPSLAAGAGAKFKASLHSSPCR